MLGDPRTIIGCSQRHDGLGLKWLPCIGVGRGARESATSVFIASFCPHAATSFDRESLEPIVFPRASKPRHEGN